MLPPPLPSSHNEYHLIFFNSVFYNIGFLIDDDFYSNQFVDDYVLNIQAMDDSGVQATIQEHILFVLIYDTCMQ